MKNKLITIIMAAIIVLTLASCGAQNDPKSTVDAYMKACQKLDGEKMEEYFPGQGSAIDEEAYGDSESDFFSRITYKLEDTAIDGDKATQKLQITTVDMATIMAEVISESATEMLSHLGDSEFDSDTFINELLREKMSSPDAKLITTTVTVNLEKNADGKWIISAPEQNIEFLNALSGGIVNSLTTALDSLIG